MNRIKRYLKRIRLVYRRSTTLTKAVVLSAAILCFTALIVLQLSIGASRDRAKALADQAAQYQYQNQQYQDKIDSLGSADSVEEIAKDELGLVDPDTVIIEDQD